MINSVTIVDRGHGNPIVLVPSLQGRWEYLEPAVDALTRSHRVITFSLRDEQGGLDGLVAQVEAALDDREITRATICGVSFGGRIALRFAARRPERTEALVLVSAPGPGWHLRPSHRWAARHPRLAAPAFFSIMGARLWSELAVAIPDRRQRRDFVMRQGRQLWRAPLSPTRMAARAALIDGLDIADECAAVSAPTLIISGEAHLDHVVPAGGAADFARLIPGSRSVTLAHTGHLGCITRPQAFAEIVDAFLAALGA